MVPHLAEMGRKHYETVQGFLQALLKKFFFGSSHCGSAEKNPKDSGLILGLGQWVKDLVWL